MNSTKVQNPPRCIYPYRRGRVMRMLEKINYSGSGQAARSTVAVLRPWSWNAVVLAKTLHVTKYGSTLYIGMDEVVAHYACTFENSHLYFYFQS